MNAHAAARRRRWKTASVVTLAAASIAAALTVWARSHAPEVLPLAPVSLQDIEKPIEPRGHKVAVVLGGGGLRGFAHIGVLRALEEHGIKPDIVVGTSAGALVGAAYASGVDLDQLEAEAASIDVVSLIDWTLEPGGFMQGVEISRWVDHITNGQPIEAFPTRFGAVATDLHSGKAVMIETGRPGDAVRASAAVPGAAVPVTYPGGRLVDGGVTSLVPVRFARALGAHKIIAVDIYCTGNNAGKGSAVSTLKHSMHIQTCLMAEQEMTEADIAIRVAVPMPQLSDVRSRQAAIAAGYRAGRLAMGALGRAAGS
jgi:NTE family protein